MSIHTKLSHLIDDLEVPSTPRHLEAYAERKIIQALAENEIDEEDFHYYCARLRLICQRRKEAA